MPVFFMRVCLPFDEIEVKEWVFLLIIIRRSHVFYIHNTYVTLCFMCSFEKTVIVANCSDL